MTKKRWTITADKFLNKDQVLLLITHLTEKRDLAIARGNGRQAIKDYYLVRGLLESGARVSEFCQLKNVDFVGLRLVIRCGKGGKDRTVLLTRSTAILLKEWTEIKVKLGFSGGQEGPLFPSRFDRHYSVRGIQDRVKIVFKAAGLPAHFSCHSLRHTYCSLLLQSGQVGLARVRDNMGHHSISVTDLYAHATGTLEDVELFPQTKKGTKIGTKMGTQVGTQVGTRVGTQVGTVENREKYAVGHGADSEKLSKSVKAFLRKTHLK